ncbi:MAG: nuclear transport factor 2 family protein [Algibacter sp.]|uniref:nuclear transport factor 2 family protein n=1 Tax=Algibacter sp. TaxID=1872428 RepID=UPI0032984506
MCKTEIAKNYLKHLESRDMEKVIDMFNDKGTVESPIYGVKKAGEFYRELNSDTLSSELYLKGVFEEKESNSLALYFTYKWILKSKKKVEFDVVDIIELDSENKIKTLKIIYDTVVSRNLINELNQK